MALALMLLAALSACAPIVAPPAVPSASRPDLMRFRELIPGVSTIADARAKLGTPNSTTYIGLDQTLGVQWMDTTTATLLPQVVISFGPDGKMIRVVTATF